MLLVVCVSSVGVVWSANQLRPASRQALRVTRATFLTAFVFAVCGIATTIAASAASETMQEGLSRKPSGQLFGAIADKLTDFDRDGYGLTGKLVDPAPFDASVFPYAIDIPGDGIDQDGVGGDLPPGPAYFEDRPSHVWRSHPNVILVVLESFRADALGRTVNGRPVTPVLDGIASRGVSASLAFSQNGYTAQSRFHIFSGSLAGLRGGWHSPRTATPRSRDSTFFRGASPGYAADARSSTTSRLTGTRLGTFQARTTHSEVRSTPSASIVLMSPMMRVRIERTATAPLRRRGASPCRFRASRRRCRISSSIAIDPVHCSCTSTSRIRITRITTRVSPPSCHP
jgi:hypothetical protein